MGRPKAKTDKLKEAFIEVLYNNLGVVTSACKKSGVPRRTYYQWLEKDADFKKACDDVIEEQIDFAESSLFQQIKDKVPSSTIFFLKTKGRKRGYIERHEIEHSGEIAPGLNVLLPEIPSDEEFEDEL